MRMAASGMTPTETVPDAAPVTAKADHSSAGGRAQPEAVTACDANSLPLIDASTWTKPEQNRSASHWRGDAPAMVMPRSPGRAPSASAWP